MRREGDGVTEGIVMLMFHFTCLLVAPGIRWTIWPSTLSRDYLPSPPPALSPAPAPSSSTPPPPPQPPKEGLPHPAIQQALRPGHHQFYGWWRTMDVRDGLDKWEGYASASERVEE